MPIYRHQRLNNTAFIVVGNLALKMLEKWALIVRALHGVKAAGCDFWHHLRSCMQFLGFNPRAGIQMSGCDQLLKRMTDRHINIHYCIQMILWWYLKMLIVFWRRRLDGILSHWINRTSWSLSWRTSTPSTTGQWCWCMGLWLKSTCSGGCDEHWGIFG